MNVIEIADKFPTPQHAIRFFEKHRWAKGVNCPHCTSTSISPRQADERFKCRDCRRGFSITTNTYLHQTHIPLRTWLFAFGIIADAKKGLSALQLQRHLGLTYKTSFYMYHTIRDIMSEEKVELLEDVVEMDETYVGGKPRKPNIKRALTEDGKEYLIERTEEVKNLGFDLSAKKGNTAKVDLGTKRGRGSQKLIPVTGIVQRDGAVIAEVMSSLGAKKLEALVKKHVDLSDSLLITDTYKGYSKIGKIIEHIKIDHSRLYSYNGVNTNTIESFWAIVERGIIGQYHSTSLKYLPKYIVEFCFKYNNRNFDDMFETLVKASMRVKIPNAIIHDPNKPKKASIKPSNQKKGNLGSKKPKVKPKLPF
ncbi:MAG: IS1595 family transposase [Saprospiraceae bacterium]|nr:IS1595 family transposase [Saprospiraceae bacterium]